MRSRCLGSMLAWILNTKPENFGSFGQHPARPPPAGRARAPATVRRASNSDCTPKLLTAEPKNTGVCFPARYSWQHRRRARRRTSSMSVRSSSAWVPISHRRASLSSPLMFSGALLGLRVEEADGVVVEVITPRKRLPMPIGRVIGAHWMPSTDSISSSRSIGSLPSRSSLLMKVQDRRVAHAADVEQRSSAPRRRSPSR